MGGVGNERKGEGADGKLAGLPPLAVIPQAPPPLEDLTTVYAGDPIEIKAEAQDDRLLLLQALEAEGAPDAVVCF